MTYHEIAEAHRLLQSNKFHEAIEFLDKLLLRETSKKDSWDMLILFNNYLIACFHTGAIEKGIDFFYAIKDFASYNPNIYHNAACLYCRANRSAEALSMIKMANKYGGKELIDVLKNDPDLKLIASDPYFKTLIDPSIRTMAREMFCTPYEGVEHFQFNSLGENEFISIFFTFRKHFNAATKDAAKELINQCRTALRLSNLKSKFANGAMGWQDQTEVGKNFICFHFSDIWQPRPIMRTVNEAMKTLPEELIHTFFVKRYNAYDNSGAIHPAMDYSHLYEYTIPESIEEFWLQSFDINSPYPLSEYSGPLASYGHHNGSLSEELRTMTYDPEFRISYGLCNYKILDQPGRAVQLYKLIQEEFMRFFDEIPTIMNDEGDLKIDRIESNGRKGYRFILRNDSLMMHKHSFYVFRLKEAELFTAIKASIATAGLSPIIHWERNNFFTFMLFDEAS